LEETEYVLLELLQILPKLVQLQEKLQKFFTNQTFHAKTDHNLKFSIFPPGGAPSERVRAKQSNVL
jgi:hypothetical protein